jgi:phosphoribosylformylglycinamidine synthase
MTVIVEVMPKEGILDPQGKAIQQALHQLGYREVIGVKMGKRIQLEVDTSDRDEALQRAEEMAQKLLHNENVESYRIVLGEETVQ